MIHSVELSGILSEFRDALEDEIGKIRNSGQSSTLLYAGKSLERPGTDFWFHFSVEYLPALPADTPCKLLIGKDQFDVTVVSCEENGIIVSSKTPLPETIGKATLENGATVLMERLIKCIEENANIFNPAGKRMLPPDGCIYTARRIFSYKDLTLNEDNTPAQNKAIEMAITNDITYIWGPPGTGKTTVIGQIIDVLFHRDRSVLVVSHTNTAVDGAINKAYEAYSKTHHDDKYYPILRIGNPVKKLSENGIDFRKNAENPVFHPSDDWCCGRAIDADVCVWKGRLHLYFATRNHEMRIQQIGGAWAALDSGFGKEAWTQLANRPLFAPELIWEGECTEAPATIVDQGKLYLFYGGSYNCTPQQIGCAVSTDGITFQRTSSLPFLPCGSPGTWNSSESGHPFAFRGEDGSMYLFYQGSSDGGKTWYLSRVQIGFQDGKPVLIGRR